MREHVQILRTVLSALRDLVLAAWIVAVGLFGYSLSAPLGGKTEAMLPAAIVSLKKTFGPILSNPKILRRVLSS